MMREEGNNLP
jgi:hypothetical protein